MSGDSENGEAWRKELRRRSRRLSGAPVEAESAELRRVAQWCDDHSIEADEYGEGDGLQAFEQRVADMLGCPAARFMPSGTMAQQIAMRVWTERAAVPVIGLHPTSHLLLHEESGYERLHGLHAVHVGEADRPMTAADLTSTTRSMAALIVEVPTRENGGQLTEWDDLVALSQAAHERGIKIHLDGARLWEAAAGYERPLDQICALFDSTYVSFYKGIRALPGSMLAGPADFVADAATWQRRHGGNLFTQMANWASADMRLDAQLEKMPSYRHRAAEVASRLGGLSGITLNPPTPQVNMFHVRLQGEKESLLQARDRVAEAHDIWLFSGLAETDDPNTWKFELVIGDAALALDLDEIIGAFEAFLQG